MQPNITSTSGNRSDRRAPLEDIRRELPEEIYIDSDYSCDGSTSARALPITHHIKPRHSFVEGRRYNKFRTFSNESLKSSTVSHGSNLPLSDTTEKFTSRRSVSNREKLATRTSTSHPYFTHWRCRRYKRRGRRSDNLSAREFSTINVRYVMINLLF